MEKIVITGGAGFVGSHLSKKLLEMGYEVHIIDNFLSGKKSNVPKGAFLHKIDIRNYARLAPVLSNTSYVFHFAALPNVEYSIQNPEISHNINVNGTLNIYHAAAKTNVKKIIFASSCSVYGDQKQKKFKETTPPCPKSPYALHKYIGEQYAKLWNELYGLNVVCLRFFNIYGPGQRDTGPYAFVIAIFLRLKSLGKPLTITGTGKQTRDFVHVSDVVSACVAAMKSPTLPGDVINIGSGKNTSVNTIAKLVGGETVYIPKRIEPQNACAEISKALLRLKWEPKVLLRNGIQELKDLISHSGKFTDVRTKESIKRLVST